jgi:NADH:ubiquinone oxidoreductase subunit 2 (subunit N)
MLTIILLLVVAAVFSGLACRLERRVMRDMWLRKSQGDKLLAASFLCAAVAIFCVAAVACQVFMLLALSGWTP